MTRTILTYLFTFSFYWCSAIEIDSLKQAYEIETDDSLKARTCLKIGDYYEDIEINKSIKWGN